MNYPTKQPNRSLDTNFFCIFVCAIEVPWKCSGSIMEVPWKCHWSAVEVLLKCKYPTANSQSHTPSPANFPTIHSRLVQNRAFYQSRGEKPFPPFVFKIVSSQANIRNTIFNQRSPQHPEVAVSRRHRQTNITTIRLNRPSGPIQWK